MKLKLSYDAEVGYSLWKPGIGKGSLLDVELPENEYADYLDVQKRVEEWQKKLDALWDATEVQC